MFKTAEIPAQFREFWEKVSVYQNLTIVTSKVMNGELKILRNKHTPRAIFRGMTNLVTADIMRAVVNAGPEHTVKVQTPVAEFDTTELEPVRRTIVPIIRGGIAMIHGSLKTIPDASIAFIGMYRDEITHKPVRYYDLNAPSDISAQYVTVIDPMLATGGSAIDTIDELIREGVPEDQIEMACIFAAPEGVDALLQAHPKVRIYTASLDWGLNPKKFILPGCGDFGDRWCGTAGW